MTGLIDGHGEQHCGESGEHADRQRQEQLVFAEPQLLSSRTPQRHRCRRQPGPPGHGGRVAAHSGTASAHSGYHQPSRTGRRVRGVRSVRRGCRWQEQPARRSRCRPASGRGGSQSAPAALADAARFRRLAGVRTACSGNAPSRSNLQDFTMNEPRKGIGAVGRSVSGHIPVRRCRTISSA